MRGSWDIVLEYGRFSVSSRREDGNRYRDATTDDRAAAGDGSIAGGRTSEASEQKGEGDLEAPGALRLKK